MRTFKGAYPMAGFIITISAESPENWQIGRDAGMWAMKRHKRIKSGDDIFFWQSKLGLFAHALATTDAVRVSDADALPWPDRVVETYVSEFQMDLVSHATPVIERWGQIQEILGTQRGANTGPVEFDTSLVDQFTVLFEPTTHRPSRTGPPEESLAVPEPDTDELAKDEREYAYRAIARRRGQATFRSDLLRAFDSTCAVTGCSTNDVLEAAHILPYRGPHTNRTSNGLLLRSDIHTLFDLYLLTVLPDGSVKIHPSRHADYGDFDGRIIKPRPGSTSYAPSQDALIVHNGKCNWVR